MNNKTILSLKIGESIPSNYTGIVKWENGIKDWIVKGKRHCENGPAIEFPAGFKYWYLNGTYYSEEEWKEEVKKIK